MLLPSTNQIWFIKDQDVDVGGDKKVLGGCSAQILGGGGDKILPGHFSRGGQNFARGGQAPPGPRLATGLLANFTKFTKIAPQFTKFMKTFLPG
jgi:hypothetical protein